MKQILLSLFFSFGLAHSQTGWQTITETANQFRFSIPTLGYLKTDTLGLIMHSGTTSDTLVNVIVTYMGNADFANNPEFSEIINYTGEQNILRIIAKLMLLNTDGELTEFQIIHDGLLYKEANVGLKNGFLTFSKIIIEPNKLMVFQVIGDESKTNQILQARSQLFSSVYLFRH
ncbi:MAG: hypothetical protein SNJ77_04240 [Cytophagales bacterium]